MANGIERQIAKLIAAQTGQEESAVNTESVMGKDLNLSALEVEELREAVTSAFGIDSEELKISIESTVGEIVEQVMESKENNLF